MRDFVRRNAAAAALFLVAATIPAAAADCSAAHSNSSHTPTARVPDDDFPQIQQRWKAGNYYDANSGLALRVQAVPDAYGTITVSSANAKPKDAKLVPLSAWHLRSGLRVGVSKDDVYRLEGRASIIYSCGTEIWKYVVDPEVGNELIIIIQKGHVFSITRTWGD